MLSLPFQFGPLGGAADAVRLRRGFTVMECEAELEDVELKIVTFTVYVPGATKACTGFCKVEVEPSPKDHDHRVGDPEE